jgi:type IV pilus assembly protein PilA
MVVVALVGVLTAIGLPAFNTYQRKAYVTEGIGLAKPVQIQIIENATIAEPAPPSGMGFDTLPYTLSITNPSHTVKNLVAYSNTIAITYNKFVDPAGMMEYTLFLKGSFVDSKMDWVCLSGDAAVFTHSLMLSNNLPIGLQPLPAHLAPSSCQG